MIKLKGFPKNKDFCIKLLNFFKEVLDICCDLNITPILDGSLAVFAYTKNNDMIINDIDLSVSEADFPKIIKVLKEKNIDYRLKEYHVLQVLKDDLKIDLGSVEHWLKRLGISTKNCEILQINEHQVKMLSLENLMVYYKKAMELRMENIRNEKSKYKALKSKHEMLKSISNKMCQ